MPRTAAAAQRSSTFPAQNMRPSIRAQQQGAGRPSQAAARTGTVGAAAGHAGNTRHGAAGAPRLSSRLVAGLGAHGVRLARVLGHVGVHRLHNVRADGRHEHGGQSHLRQEKRGAGKRSDKPAVRPCRCHPTRATTAAAAMRLPQVCCCPGRPGGTRKLPATVCCRRRRPPRWRPVGRCNRLLGTCPLLQLAPEQLGRAAGRQRRACRPRRAPPGAPRACQPGLMPCPAHAGPPGRAAGQHAAPRAPAWLPGIAGAAPSASPPPPIEACPRTMPAGIAPARTCSAAAPSAPMTLTRGRAAAMVTTGARIAAQRGGGRRGRRLCRGSQHTARAEHVHGHAHSAASAARSPASFPAPAVPRQIGLPPPPASAATCRRLPPPPAPLCAWHTPRAGHTPAAGSPTAPEPTATPAHSPPHRAGAPTAPPHSSHMPLTAMELAHCRRAFLVFDRNSEGVCGRGCTCEGLHGSMPYHCFV